MHVESWLVRAARMRPQHVALGDVSYRTLLASARATARAAELAPGLRVGIALPPGRSFAVALHATLLAAAVAVPIDLRLTAAERPSVDLLLDAAPIVDGPQPPLRSDDRFQSEYHDLDAVAIEVRSSGSSGRPKAVGLTYGNWLWSALGSAAALGHPASERWLCALPLSHVGGLSILMRSAIAATTAIVLERFDSAQVIAALAADEAGGPATMISVVPTTLERLLDDGLSAPKALRWALLGGAPASSQLLVRAAEAGVPLATTYGMTEACSQIATAGRPLFCTRVAIADDGEILVSGPTVAPDMLDADDGLLHSGDIGALDSNGRLTVTGRAADTIISGGENIAPTEVEAVLEAHPAVAEAAAIGLADRQWGQMLVAIVRADDRHGAPTAAQLREHCALKLARFKLPKRYLRVSAPLPRTASGKLMRHKLSALVDSGVPLDAG